MSPSLKPLRNDNAGPFSAPGDDFDHVNVRDELAQLRRLRIASFLEGAMLLVLLLIAVPLKHVFDWSIGVKLIGPAHGVAVLAYLWLILQTTASAPYFNRRETAQLIILALIPMGVFFNGLLLARKNASLRKREVA